MSRSLKDGQSDIAARATADLQPVQIWAAIGALLIAVEVYFTFKWIFSDSFVAVPVGSDLPPTWMRWALDGGQALLTLGCCVCLFAFVLRPWLRERRLTTDGLIVIGCLLASFWDALSNVGQFWFTYNTYLFNRGSVLDLMPFTLSPRAPGATEAWPMLCINMLYAHFVLVAVLMCALLRFVKSRRPETGTATLLLICFALGAIADFIIEGLVLLPLGFWTYAGGHLAINAEHYYKFPLQEAIFAGCVFAAITWLRFSVDDKGQTICERGLDRITASPLKKSLLRSFAVLGGMISIFIVAYHLPQGFLALHSTAWPEEVVQNSYFNSRICGPEVDLACPGPTTPIARAGAPRPDMQGHFPQPR